MNPDVRPRSGRLAALLAATACLAGFACNKSEAAPAKGSAAETAPDTRPAPPAGPRIDTDHYTVEMKLLGDCASTKECSAEITLSTKGDYKVNDQYPHKFKAADPPPEGVTFPKPLLRKEDGSFEKKRGSFKLPFVVARAGKAKIGGVLSLSVCSEQSCLMEKQPVEIDIDVK
jgi:hypothetical protein